MTNRLAQETSPYLLQHRENPVDWYPWGEEALTRAKSEDRPILLSIGYSACHWCHVMERESFEDEATAALMNERFVSIKVDREERPDLDSLYMAAVQALTRQGGWPMTVFLTPEGAPFYGGTYFPPEPRHGLPGFKQLLTSVSDAYRERREEVEKSAGSVREFLQQATTAALPTEGLSTGTLDAAASALLSQADARYGGFGGAPKFPQPTNLEVLLRHHRRTGEQAALDHVERTLRAMAGGGIYDQLGGGFARYSVDEYWLVPHFEKMLYDNALLARLYTETYQATGDGFHARVAGETIDYVLREMTSPEGGFYSAEDADSEGVEGKFYVWSQRELRDALPPEEAELALRYWDVTDRGNFEGKNILNVPRPPASVAAEFELSGEELEERLSGIRVKLLAVREERVRPDRDEKALAAWNGLMLRALALAGAALDREDYLAAARRNAEFLLREMLVDEPEGSRGGSPGGSRLRRSYKAGEARLNGYLEDYAMVADGLLELYEATLEPRWLRAARDLAQSMLELFWDEERGAFFDTPEDHEELVARPRDIYDNATPSGNSVAAELLLRLARIFDREEDFGARARTVLDDASGAMAQIPGGFGRLLGALDFELSEAREIALVGEPDELRALHRTIYARYLPNRVVAAGAGPRDELAAEVPLLRDRPPRDGRATAYVCVHYACQRPTTDPEELARQLEG